MTSAPNHISFFIPCVPPKSTHQMNVRVFRGKDGKAFVGRSKAGKAAREERHLMELLRPHAPDWPLRGAVSLNVQWSYPWRKCEPKRNRIHGSLPCDTRPDCDNLIKGLCDVMTRLGFFTDDAAVAQLIFVKQWSDQPGIGIEIETL